MRIVFQLTVLIMLTLVACKSDKKEEPKTVVSQPEVKKLPRAKVPKINEDSAYAFVQKQVSFGPRVPGSDAHTACKKWLKSKFESYGANVVLQDFEGKIYTGQVLPSTNIIAQINPSIQNRIILAAHWDSRMMAENDTDVNKQQKAIDGADDGASGVGVLLEIARTIQENPINLGIDFILFDTEDQGSRAKTAESITTWCLGSQYWAKNPTYQFKPMYGILLDMVGAKDAIFYQEGYSRQFAPGLTNRIWSLAKKMNAGNLFSDLPGGGITDDHYYINTMANIPMVDIINTSRTTENGFGPHWHTHDDNMKIISKETLKRVTQIVTAVAYKTSDNSL